MAEITGTTDNDTLVGTPGADIIHGLAGNDSIDGGAGADQMDGGPGDDTYFVDDAGDTIIEAQGDGFDNVASSVSYHLNAGAWVEILSTTNHAGTDNINLTGNEIAQILLGNAGANVLNGGGGADTLTGFGGDDTYFVDADDVVREDAGGGFDYVVASGTYTLNFGAEIELLGTTNNAGTEAIDLTGNNFAQVIIGNAGMNSLRGGPGGGDVLVGFGGDDTYFVDGDDQVREDAGGGFDYVVTTTSYALNFGAEIELLGTTDNAGTDAIDLTGNNFAQVIIGNAGKNSLRGGPGGGDVLVGFGGDDTYFVDADDQVREDAGGGFDYVVASSDYALNFGAEIELLGTVDNNGLGNFTLTGNNFTQIIIGNAGDNILNGGGGGADILNGLAGNDTLFVDADDIVREEVGNGYDYVVVKSSYALNAGAEIELMTTTDNAGTSAFNLTGNEFANIIQGNNGENVLSGGGGNDRLVGLGGSDTLYGGDGDDMLIGGDGSDEFHNSSGNDTFVGGLGGDYFVFDAAIGAGVMTIVDFELNFDRFRLDGSAGGAFAGLATGPLLFGTVVTAAAALDPDDFIIYNSATGALLYDADGNGAGAAVQFAKLGTGLLIDYTSFETFGAINHAPTLTSGATATVAENSPASTIVYQATSLDADGDRVAYQLSGEDADLLTVDAAGAIRLRNPADFEHKSVYHFGISAYDSAAGSPTKQVTLTITDLPDNSATPLIAEKSGANDTIPTKQLIDRDIFLIANNPNLPDPSLPSATIQGLISNPFDKDFFAITLKAGELLILDVDNSSDNLDTYLRLYNPSGNDEIFANDDLAQADPGSAPHPVYGHNTDSYIRFRAPVDGIYHFSIESFQDPDHPTAGTYDLNVSIGPPATKAALFEEDIQALLSGTSWNHHDLSYGFPTSAGQYPASFEEANPASNFAPLSTLQQGATMEALQAIANVTGLSFHQETASPGTADLRYAMSSLPDTAYAYYPTNQGPSSIGGTAWFNMADYNNPVRGNYGWLTFLHETGHALGLKHGHEAPQVSAIHDTLEYTVMTYRSYLYAPTSGEDAGYTNETFGFPQSLMMLDIAALQRLYGANFAFNGGDSVYKWNIDTAEMSINGVGQGIPGATRVFMTLWDGGGNDTFDCSNFFGDTTIDLRPGEWTTLSGAWRANLGNGHFAAGNVANALLFQDDARSLIENAIGGGGRDNLIANQATNHLTGGANFDLFEWRSAADCGLGAQADVVTDFASGDKFRLALIDANSTTIGDDAFSFIGTSAFHNVAGELRYQVEGDSLRLQGDVDGNGIADMDIIVSHTTTISTFDIFL